MMATSVYATPPPDLSGEDTALSDVSNSSHQTNSSNNSSTILATSTTTTAPNTHHKTATKRTLSATSLLGGIIGNNNQTFLNDATNTFNPNNNGIGLGSLLVDSTSLLPDLSKKRRKQTTPIRISATLSDTDNDNPSGNAGGEDGDAVPAGGVDAEDAINGKEEGNKHDIKMSLIEQQHQLIQQQLMMHQQKQTQNLGHGQNNIPKIFLSNLSQLQQSLNHGIEQQLSQISSTPSSRPSSASKELTNYPYATSQLTPDEDAKDRKPKTNGEKQLEPGERIPDKIDEESRERAYMSPGQILRSPPLPEREKSDKRTSPSVKKERSSPNREQEWKNHEDKTASHAQQQIMMSAGQGMSKPEDWLSLAGLSFPFPPEAAAALSASGYLPQMPMMGVPSGVSPFSGADGIPRSSAPPLRIFNPEAYCDLCNKEFCNKYFLKTHKANKHGIYEAPTTNTEMSNLNQLSQMQQMTQVLQFQQQQQQHQQAAQVVQQVQQQHQQQQQQQKAIQEQSINAQASISPVPAQQSSPSQSALPTVEQGVFCDICFKKFTNIFGLRKHKAKLHPQTNGEPKTLKLDADAVSETEQSPPLKTREIFREDYSIEQEDASFTPQPFKLSPQSMQQARDSNFSVDKLKSLGVINIEAFCELCCKEYCNKYFLRTHKLKRHGIIPPTDDHGKDERPAWHYVQTSPLNLIMSGGETKTAALLSKLCAEQGENSKALLLRNMQTNAEEKIVAKSEPEDEMMEDMHSVSSKKSPELQQTSQDSDAISVDLQKLQTMILQLNDLNATRSASCTICGKEMENQYMLHSHMISEHGGGMIDNNNGAKDSQNSTPTLSQMEPEVCRHCEKEFANVYMLKQHIIEVHGMQPTSPLHEGFLTPDRKSFSGLSLPSIPSQSDRKPPYILTPTSSYCEICNKELCNKYFMKTHMQRMHGIEIENGAQIGGVVCNVCNKELCSKYFLRVHKHNTHGIIEDGSPLPTPRPNGDSESESGFPMESLLKPGEIAEFGNRYFSHFTEVCPLCSRRFRSSKWLRAHLLSDHGKAGTEKLRELESKLGSLSQSSSPTLKIPNGAFGLGSPEPGLLSKSSLSNLFASESSVSSAGGVKGYKCSYCAFNTPLLALLFIHERSHQGMNLSHEESKDDDDEEEEGELLQNPHHLKHAHQMHLLKLHQQQQQQQLEYQESLQSSPSILSSHLHQHRNHLLVPSPPNTPTHHIRHSKSSEHNKSETAVSIAKDQPIISRNSIPSSSETPTLTPATTPVPTVPQEVLYHPKPSTPVAASSSIASSVISPAPSSMPSIAGFNNILSDMSNITQRPAMYALPQSAGPFVMQSFLIAEDNSASAAVTTNGKQGNFNDLTNNQNRFVPAVVFLPVKERILAPLTVSFTLSPA